MNSQTSKLHKLGTAPEGLGDKGSTGLATAALPTSSFHGKPGRSGPPGNTNARTHGGSRASADLKELRRRALDGRTTEARLVRELENDLIDSLGGPDEVSTQKRWLIERAAMLQLQLSAVDAFVVSMPSIANKKRRALYPIVKESASLAQSLQSLLVSIGLERRARTVKLSDYISERTTQDADTAPQEDAIEKTQD